MDTESKEENVNTAEPAAVPVDSVNPAEENGPAAPVDFSVSEEPAEHAEPAEPEVPEEPADVIAMKEKLREELKAEMKAQTKADKAAAKADKKASRDEKKAEKEIAKAEKKAAKAAEKLQKALDKKAEKLPENDNEGKTADAEKVIAAKVEENENEEDTALKFSGKQFIWFIVIALFFALTLTSLVLGYIIPAIVLTVAHGAGMLIFMYVDTVQRNIDADMSDADNDNDGRNGSDGQTMTDADRELLESLQEKCRAQVAEIESLRDQLEKGTQEVSTANRELEKVQKAYETDTLLPESKCVNNFEPVNIILIANQVVEMFRPSAERAGVNVTVSAASDNIMVKADPMRINILFRNIVDNSIKYMQRSGSLVITVSTIGDDIFIVLKDNGNGLSEDETERIFELNYQGSNRISGNGLGLAQAKAIVNSYGGTIYAKSTVGSGMGIYIQLPTK